LCENTTTDDPDDFRYPPWLTRNDGSLPEKVFVLRQKLYRKAKSEPRFRFYALYDRIYRPDVLRAAWARVAGNDGAPGVDGVSVADVHARPGGVEAFLADIGESLRAKTYRPEAVRRKMIAKPGGGQRPLGIPTVRDRVVQTATLLVLEPIFESGFEDSSYGFRPDRSALDALAAVGAHVRSGRHEVYDADLQSYFDTIPHDKLMRCVEMRVVDRSVLSLIRMWLDAPVEEEDPGEPGRRRRRRNEAGTPQGGVISPLLANIYLSWLDKLFMSAAGPGTWANARIVRYADDFVVLARHVGTRIERWLAALLEDRMGLTINRKKTRILRVAPGGATLDFLGYSLRYEHDLHGRDHEYLSVHPSAKSLQRVRAKVHELTSSRHGCAPIDVVVSRLNSLLRGWWGYFGRFEHHKARSRVNWYVYDRLVRHLRRRSQRPLRPPKNQTWYAFVHSSLGLMRI
jgi:RNA-directed DNA polymerase